jgi:hypothetical protein
MNPPIESIVRWVTAHVSRFSTKAQVSAFLHSKTPEARLTHPTCHLQRLVRERELLLAPLRHFERLLVP